MTLQTKVHRHRQTQTHPQLLSKRNLSGITQLQARRYRTKQAKVQHSRAKQRQCALAPSNPATPLPPPRTVMRQTPLEAPQARPARRKSAYRRAALQTALGLLLSPTVHKTRAVHIKKPLSHDPVRLLQPRQAEEQVRKLRLCTVLNCGRWRDTFKLQSRSGW
eukprot:COSAG02_NODE_6743_length_3389_cov_1.334347_5_plen_163_part_00